MDFTDELLMNLLEDLNITETTEPVVSQDFLLASIDEELSLYLQQLLTDEQVLVNVPKEQPKIEEEKENDDEAVLTLIKELLHEMPQSQDLLEQQASTLQNLEHHIEHLYKTIDTLREEIMQKLPPKVIPNNNEGYFIEKPLAVALPTLQLSKLYLPTAATVMYQCGFLSTNQ